MSAKLKHLSLLLVLSIPVLILIVFTVQLWIFDYEVWAEYFLKIAGKEGWETYFKEKILDERRFEFLKVISLFLTFSGIVISFFIYKKRAAISSTLAKDIDIIKKTLTSTYNALNIKERLFLAFVLIFFISRAIYSISGTELQYDEAWTFVHFSSKGFLVSAFSPNNNHQLYSLVSAAFWKMNFDAKLAVRLPALLFSSFSLFLLFIYTLKTFGKKISIVTVTVLSVSIPFYFFSVLGRAYAPMLFFVLLSSFSVLKIEKNNVTNDFLLRIYVLSSVLGIYSNLSFLYFWLLNLIVFILTNLYHKALLYSFIKSNLVVSVFTVLLLFPMAIAGGINVLGTAAETNIEAGDFLLYLHRLSDWLLLGFKWNLFFIFSGLSLLCFLVNLMLFKFNKNRETYLLQVYWLWPFLIFIVSGIESPYRIWFWMPVFFWLHLVIIFYSLKIYNVFKIAIFATLILFNFYISQNHYFMNWSLSLDKESKKIARIILENKSGAITCYSFSRYDKPLLDYYFLINNRSFKTYMPFKESKNYMAFKNKIYDAVLLDTEDYEASSEILEILNNKYRIAYQNSRVKLYLLLSA